MKKLIALAALFLTTLGYSPSFAGDRDKDCIKMKDGKLWVMRDGKKTQLTQDMTLSDGSKVMTNGTVVMKDGTSKMMTDGDKIMMDGTWKKDKDDKDMKDKKDKM